MKCLIPGPNVKILGRAVQALARIGEELYVEAKKEGLSLRALSPSETAYSAITFSRAFFTCYNHGSPGDQGLECKISMKSALSVFRSPAALEKQVEQCEIRLDAAGCKLLFQLRCRYGVVRTHYLSILDCKKLETVYTKETAPNRLSVQHKVLSDAVSNFQTNEDQVTVEVTSLAFLIRNYVDASLDLSKIIRTQLALQPAEFDSYFITQDTNITFSMKEFRAVLTFAECVNLPVELNFETTGKPAVFVINNNSTFEANFVMATERFDPGTQLTATTTATPQINKQTNISSKKRNGNVDESRAAKKRHLDNDNDLSKYLDEDSHLFNFVEMPDDTTEVNNDKIKSSTTAGINKVDNISSKSIKANNKSVNVNCEVEKNNLDLILSNGSKCDNLKNVSKVGFSNFVFDDMEDDSGNPEEGEDIPGSPICNTQVRNIKTVFKRCFEATFHPTKAHGGAHSILAEDSD